ncbi:MAG: D-2-hydroxyacid dehydrogenase [Gammaproteobacteria bacterium]|nr:MAG: D-2-hydroxyacid dehydrogenase [Gammaproteobacteria bacterium]
MLTAVFLDADSMGADLDFAALNVEGVELICWPQTPPGETAARLKGATVAITNKVVIDRAVMQACPDLRLICVTATGMNNIDLEAAEASGIQVLNVTHYGTAAVVQHAVTLMLALSTRLVDYVADVRAGAWQQAEQFCLMHHPVQEVAGKTLAIVGYGDLGQRMAQVCQALGMHVIVAARPGQVAGRRNGVTYVPWNDALGQADVLSLHCLLSPQTERMINAEALARMKNGALLINTARGGLVDEPALLEALESGHLGGAGLDVLSEEPPRRGNVLLEANLPNLLITPHCAWVSKEARQRIIDRTGENLRAGLRQLGLRT